MFEVKIHVNVASERGLIAHTFTIATFDEVETSSRRYIAPTARVRAVAFAKQIDKGYGVTVQNVEDEDNRDRNFGLVYERVPGENSIPL